MSKGYLLDTSALVTPYQNYYPPDLVPEFWNNLIEFINNGEGFIHVLVKKEIKEGNDDLVSWLKNINEERIIDHKYDIEIITNYQRVLKHIKNCGFYQEKCYKRWYKKDIADPFLIATALTRDLTIVTAEVRTTDRSTKFPIGKNTPKIPDICDDLGVRCINLIEMIRETGLKLN